MKIIYITNIFDTSETYNLIYFLLYVQNVESFVAIVALSTCFAYTWNVECFLMYVTNFTAHFLF